MRGPATGKAIAWLRGVNVGGHGKLPMKALREALAARGFGEVATYIQSGNLVLGDVPDPVACQGALAAAIEEDFGFRPAVMVWPAEQVHAAVAAGPFAGEDLEARTVHLFFLAEPPPSPDHARLEELAAASERHALVGRVLYLHAPDGIGRSKLAAGAEWALGVPATARNLRTVGKVLELAGLSPGGV